MKRIEAVWWKQENITLNIMYYLLPFFLNNDIYSYVMSSLFSTYIVIKRILHLVPLCSVSSFMHLTPWKKHTFLKYLFQGENPAASLLFAYSSLLTPWGLTCYSPLRSPPQTLSSRTYALYARDAILHLYTLGCLPSQLQGWDDRFHTKVIPFVPRSCVTVAVGMFFLLDDDKAP